MTSSFLAPPILEEIHSAADYLHWVRKLIAQVKEEPDGLRRIRLREGLLKELMNEALPVGLLASNYFGGSDKVSIQLKVGNQNYDALIADRRICGSGVEYLEVTLAGDGEDDYLRMRALHENGEVSGLGTVTKIGTKTTGLKIHVESEMISQAEQLRREQVRISRAIERKLSKKYPPNTLLLVAFDDAMAFDRSDNMANAIAAVESFLPKLQHFHSVALVGLKADMFLSWPLAGTAIL